MKVRLPRHAQSNSVDLGIVVAGAVAIVYLFAGQRDWDEAAQAALIGSLGVLVVFWRVKHGQPTKDK
jgi:fructose-1,6-bisphosphatase/inositol monophosphatase family enzyme